MSPWPSAIPSCLADWRGWASPSLGPRFSFCKMGSVTALQPAFKVNLSQITQSLLAAACCLWTGKHLVWIAEGQAEARSEASKWSWIMAPCGKKLLGVKGK